MTFKAQIIKRYINFMLNSYSRAVRIYEICGNLYNAKGPPTKTALELYNEEILNGCILSYREPLDIVLKDVIIPQTITEFAGESGSGKTQICITVQLPKWCGGFGGEALYVNTNSNFSSRRIRELAKNFIDQYNNLEIKATAQNYNFTEDYILKHIHHIRVTNALELISFVNLLETSLKDKKIRVLVIDSISFPLRLLDIKERKTIVCKIFRDLRNLASKYNFAVVITNDLTTRVKEGESYITPSFGDSFYHLVNSRCLFSRRNSVFHIKLAKSICGNNKETLFCV